MVFTIPGLSHHQIVDSLLWPRSLGWLVAQVVSRILRIFLHRDVISVQLSIGAELASFEDMGCGSRWDFVLHVREFSFEIHFWLVVSPHVDVRDWVLLHE